MGNIKPFKGQVKVSDIQEAFDFLVNKINDKIDMYNSTLEAVETIDFNVGNPNLSPKGYALSVGGLKSIIRAYGTFVIGCNVFYANTNKVIVSGGVVFYAKNNSVERVVIKRQSLTGINWDTYGIYLDKNTGNLTPTKSSSTILIRPINHNRINNTNKYRLENTTPYLVEDIGSYKLRSTGNAAWFADTQTAPSWDASRFVTVAEDFPVNGASARAWTFNGTNIGACWGTGRGKMMAMINRIWLWLPRHISSPLGYSGGSRGNTTKYFGCKITR